MMPAVVRAETVASSTSMEDRPGDMEDIVNMKERRIWRTGGH